MGLAEADRSGAKVARARLARAGWAAAAAAPGLACAFAGGRAAWLAAAAALGIAAAAALSAAPLPGFRRTRGAPTSASGVDAPRSGVLARDAFMRRVADDVAGGAIACGVLGVFHIADAEALATFDAPAADRLMRACELRLRRVVEGASAVARLRHGGFAVWLPAVDDADGGVARLQAVADVLSQPLGEDGPPLGPSVTTAAALYPRDGCDAAELLRCAGALLAATGATTGASGGAAGAVATVASPVTAAARDRFSLHAELRGAMARDELRLQFQPVVDVAARRVTGAEALLRWTSAARGPVPPAAFVPLLEESGLIEAVGLWVLDAACAQLGAWSAGPLAGVTVAVNVSARQFRDGRLPRLVAERLERHGVAPARLELELTETAAVDDEARTRRLIGELHELGVGVASDDFGSGWSSISHLKSRPFSKLKIDREFVTKVDARPDSRAICRSVIELGRGLGMTVLAEGVERREEVEVLLALGCSLFQGYWFSRPLDVAAFARRAADPSWLADLSPPGPAARRRMAVRRA